MAVPPEPQRFAELCEKIGLAMMLSQKVQFALGHYFAVFNMVKSGWSKTEAKESIRRHLSKSMGVVVAHVENSAPLEQAVAEEVREFKALRNWLVHDFDEESTPFLAQGERFDEYIAKMEEIAVKANKLMVNLGAVGEKLIPVREI